MATNKQAHDHMRVVYGLRRQIKWWEGRYNYLLIYGFSNSSLRTEAEAERHALLKVLLAYQLATYYKD